MKCAVVLLLLGLTYQVYAAGVQGGLTTADSTLPPGCGSTTPKSSMLTRNSAETAMFLLVAVCFVLLLALLMLLFNYCEGQKTIKKLEAKLHGTPEQQI